MTFANEQGFARTNPPITAGGGDLAMPDWHGLRARFAASHAAMRVLKSAAAGHGGHAARGSFDPTSALLLDAYPYALSSVNPTGLADGKLVGAIDDAVAGASKAGG